MNNNSPNGIGVLSLGLALAFLIGWPSFAGATEEKISLHNEHMEIVMEAPASGGRILSIRNKAGFDFINRRGLPLWRIEAKQIPTEMPIEKTTPLQLDPEQSDGVSGPEKSPDHQGVTITSESLGGSSAIVKTPGRYELIWKNMDLGDEPGVLDVTVEVSLLPGDRFARFRTKIANRSAKFTVFYLYSPMVSGIYPSDNRLEDDMLATPSHSGRLIRNPIDNGVLGQKSLLQPNRSSHSMQFDAYTHNGNGLFLAALDGRQTVKRFNIETNKETGLSWSVVHLPNNMKAIPQIWDTPYDTVIGCFDGDWFDACRWYREWALKQEWASAGKLITKASTPRWFKEIDEWMLLPVPKKDTGFDPFLAADLEPFNVGLWITYWGREGYFLKGTPDIFPLRPIDQELIKQAKDAGYPIMAYLQGICWDTESESFKKEGGFDHAVRNFMGQNIIWDFSKLKEPSIQMITSPGPVWEKILGGTLVEMAKAGIKAAYLDSADHGGTYLNFNPAYGSDSGGGDAYISGSHRLLRNIREMARKVDPEFCTTVESFWEGSLADTDGFLVSNSTNQFLAGSVTTAIPMAQAVYHDYTILYASWVSPQDLEEDNGRAFLAKNAQDFVWGVKPGWNQPSYLQKFKNHEIARTSSLLRYQAYAAGKKFLLYGEMLRPPLVQMACPNIELAWHISWGDSSFKVSLPPVFSSLWRSPSGEVGLVLYNWSLEPQKLLVSLPIDEAGLSTNQKFIISPIFTPEGAEASVSSSGIGQVEATIPPASPMILQIASEKL